MIQVEFLIPLNNRRKLIIINDFAEEYKMKLMALESKTDVLRPGAEQVSVRLSL